LFVRGVVAVIVWQLDYSVSIITNVVSYNLAQAMGTRYNIM